MQFRVVAAGLVVLISCSAALANEVQFHICAAGQNLGQAYARTQYFNGEIGPDQSVEIALNLANAAAEIAAAEAGVQQPFFTSPERQRSIAELQSALAAYARNAEGRSPAARMSMIQAFYTHYREALSLSYASNRPDAFRWNSTCDSRMLDANWHLGLAGTYAAVRFDRGTIEEIHARANQGGANGSAFQAIQAGLRLALDGTGPTPLEHCFFNTQEAWSIVPMLPPDEPWATYVDLLPRVLEVCRGAGGDHGHGHNVAVPFVIGLPLEDAKRRLADAGLTVQLAPGSPAVAPNGTGTIEGQSLVAGTQVAAGTPVRLTVHSPYVAPPVPPPIPSAGATPVVAQRPSWNCDLKGGYNGNRFRVTLENGRYIGRNFYELNNLPEMRRRGFHVGYVQFDVATEPEEFRDQTGNRRVGYRGRCGDGPGDRPLVYTDCFVAVSFSASAHRPLDLVIHVLRDGQLAATTNFWHDSYAYPNGCWEVAQSPTPTPAPVFQVPTPDPTAAPPPAPPACPGPGVTAVFDLWNPPPYGGLGGVICRAGTGGVWINVSNNVYPVTTIQTGAQDPASGCFAGTRVVTPAHTYEGTLCRK